ncbi:MAG: peptide chain release factor N(5)-glutamine methyltransferase [Nitrospirota bacterium]
MNSLNKLRETTEFLKRSGVDDAVREAEMIISHCFGIDRTALYRDNPQISEEELTKIDGFLKRRSKREPLQYIVGYTEFYGLKIKVGSGVLIPRPETELLVEEAIKTVKSFKLKVESEDKDSSLVTPRPRSAKRGGRHLSLIILDLCTGSGCLALALAREFPDAHIYGTDTSEIAIEYAKENAEINGIKNVTFVRGNLFEPIEEEEFDLIVSNPPYIKRDDIKDLQPEIRDWEPVEALNGGADGLDFYRTIIPAAHRYLKEGGCIILELGFKQAGLVSRIADDAGFKDISLIKDYAGIERIIKVRRYNSGKTYY